MDQDNGAYQRGRDRKSFPVAQAQLLVALEQSAVDHYGRRYRGKQVFRPCYGAGSTKKLNLYG